MLSFKFVDKAKLGPWWETGRSLERGPVAQLLSVSMKNNKFFVISKFYQFKEI